MREENPCRTKPRDEAREEKRRDARIFQKVGLDSEKSGGVQHEAHDHGADDGGGKAAHAAVKDEDRGYKEKTEKFRKPLEPGFIEKQRQKE